MFDYIDSESTGNLDDCNYDFDWNSMLPEDFEELTGTEQDRYEYL